MLRAYLQRAGGLARAQAAAIAAYLVDGRKGLEQPFRTRYSREDNLLLAKTDGLHGTLSRPSTTALLRRGFQAFGNARHERLARISNGPLYNLPRSRSYARVIGSQDVALPAVPRPPRDAPRGPPKLDMRRLDAPGRRRQGLGGQSHQCRRRGHSARVRQLRRAHFRELPTARSEASAGVLPLYRARLPFRQRLRVRTTKRPRYWRSCAWRSSLGRARGAAGQRVGREQERQLDPQSVRPGHITGLHGEHLDCLHRKVLALYLNYHCPYLFFAQVQTHANGRQSKT